MLRTFIQTHTYLTKYYLDHYHAKLSNLMNTHGLRYYYNYQLKLKILLSVYIILLLIARNTQPEGHQIMCFWPENKLRI